MDSKISNRLTNAEKKEIITYIEQNKLAKFTNVAQLFSLKFGKQISAKSIGNYSKNKESIISNAALNSDIKRITKGCKYQDLNDKLWDWIQIIESFGAVYSEKILKEKALQIAKEINLTEFKAKNWLLYSFKSAHIINYKTLSGEASDNTKQNFVEFYDETNKKMSEYDPDNIYNCEETALFFKQAPSKSLMVKARKGIKACKDRVSILLYTNLPNYQMFISGIATENELIQNIAEDLENEIDNAPIHENFLQEIANENTLSDDEVNCQVAETTKITLNDAKESFKIFKEYILENADSNTNLILNLDKFERFLNSKKDKTKNKITDYFLK